MRHVIVSSTLSLSLGFAVPAQVDPIPEAAPRVLLVGHDPQAPKLPFTSLAKPRTHRLYRERTAAFEALLRYHFDHVEVVYGADYDAAMSDDFDVTVFDCRPKALREPERGVPVYLPEGFDRPALLIAENSPWVGESLGSKFDWL